VLRKNSVVSNRQGNQASIVFFKLELELIQNQMAQKQMLRAEVYARALRASKNLKRAEVFVLAATRNSLSKEFHQGRQRTKQTERQPRIMVDRIKLNT
jgi:hypothetical protein